MLNNVKDAMKRAAAPIHGWDYPLITPYFTRALIVVSPRQFLPTASVLFGTLPPTWHLIQRVKAPSRILLRGQGQVGPKTLSTCFR